MRPERRSIICFETARISSTGASRLMRKQPGTRFVGIALDRQAVLHPGVVDQHVDAPERGDARRDRGEIGEVLAHQLERPGGDQGAAFEVAVERDHAQPRR